MKQRKTRKDKGRKRLIRNLAIGATSTGILGTAGVLLYKDKKKHPFGKPKQGVRKLTQKDSKKADKYTTVDVVSSDSPNQRKAKLFLGSSSCIDTANFGRGRDRKKRNRRRKGPMSLGKAIAIGTAITIPSVIGSSYLTGGLSGKTFELVSKKAVDKFTPKGTPFKVKSFNEYGLKAVKENLEKPGKLLSMGVLAGGTIYAASKRGRKGRFSTNISIPLAEFGRGRGKDKRKRRKRKGSGIPNLGKFLPHPNYVAAGFLIAAGAISGGALAVTGKYAINAQKLGARRLRKFPDSNLPNPQFLDEIIVGHSVFKDKYSKNKKWGKILSKYDDKAFNRGALYGTGAGVLAGSYLLASSKLRERKEDKNTKQAIKNSFYPHRKFSLSDFSHAEFKRGRDKRKRRRRRSKPLSYNQAARRTEKLANSALAIDRDIIVPATVTTVALSGGLLANRYIKGARAAAKSHNVPMGFTIGEAINLASTKKNSVVTNRIEEQVANSKVLAKLAGAGVAGLGANYVYQRYWSKDKSEAKKRKRQNKAKK